MKTISTGMLFWIALLVSNKGEADDRQVSQQERWTVAELFVMQDCPHSKKAQHDLEQRNGVQVRILDVGNDREALKRMYALAKRQNVAPRVPMLHACRKIVIGYDRPETTGRQYDSAMTIEIFTRAGCPRCTAAKKFLHTIENRYPGIRFTYRDVDADPRSRDRWEAVNRAHGVQVPGLPSFSLSGEFHVGYLGDASTGEKLKTLLDAVTVPRPLEQPKVRELQSLPSRRNADTESSTKSQPGFQKPLQAAEFPVQSQTIPAPATDGQDVAERFPVSGEATEVSSQLPPALDGPVEYEALDQTDEVASTSVIDVPVLGPLDARQLGMPVFTILIGLVDGCNPCAMWVLLFLLSLLVNLHDRRKILAVAGTFVFVSGAVYFAFMAAWLNVFRLIGYRRWSEVALGLIAMFIGSIHIKDFFALHQGVSLSIPDAAKPGIYARVRNILAAQHIGGAIAGAIVLAVLVNLVELLCTAGLPALYSKVLSMQNYSLWGEYGYLLLYNIAYMFDDGLMVALVVLTLRQQKLQERAGRWLKLLSGVAILGLGLVLLIVPEWLV